MIVHHLIEVSLLTVFWRVEGTNIGPLTIVIRMLVVCVTLACIVCVCMYTGRGLMSMLGGAHSLLLTYLYWARPNGCRERPWYVWYVVCWGEPTKLCAYGLSFVSGTSSSKVKGMAWLQRIHPCFRTFMILGLYYDNYFYFDIFLDGWYGYLMVFGWIKNEILLIFLGCYILQIKNQDAKLEIKIKNKPAHALIKLRNKSKSVLMLKLKADRILKDETRASLDKPFTLCKLFLMRMLIYFIFSLQHPVDWWWWVVNTIWY